MQPLVTALNKVQPSLDSFVVDKPRLERYSATETGIMACILLYLYIQEHIATLFPTTLTSGHSQCTYRCSSNPANSPSINCAPFTSCKALSNWTRLHATLSMRVLVR
ncbi:hypothetical protein EMIT0P253_410021 [Pseudomonas sp. IT-P253]